MLPSPLSLCLFVFLFTKSHPFPHKFKHQISPKHIFNKHKLLTWNLSLAPFSKSAVSYAYGYDQLPESKNDEWVGKGFDFHTISYANSQSFLCLWLLERCINSGSDCWKLHGKILNMGRNAAM
ncbi:hypothetical protein RIF29_41815 [Crotalaria pallida]|uniref:Uncharacterized protein n=1 Tax=Crotalaria pallida TaxID=3830 RepID=A0AAN9E820_CROPI